MKKTCILLSILLIGASVFADSQILCVDDAVKIALENNVSLAQSEITLNAAKRARNHSWNSVSPSLSVGSSASIPVNQLSDEEASYKASYNFSATASLSFSANLFTSINAAKINYELGQITFTDAMRSVELSVRQAFYGLLYAKENILLQEKNLEIAKQTYSNNLAKYNQGRLNEIDVLSAEVNYKSSIPTVESARTSYQNDLANFKQILGLDANEKIELSGSLDDMLYLDEINLDGIEVYSSQIKSLEKKISAAKNSVWSSRFSAYSPSINASFNWSNKTFYIDYDGEKKPDHAKSASITLSAVIPLDGVLPWSARNDSIDTAKDNLSSYELQLKDAKEKLQISIDAYLRSLKQNQDSIRYRQANVNLAQKSYDMTLEAYNKGTKDLLSLQTANNSLFSAQLALKNEIYTFTKNILNLENTIGVPFGTLKNEKGGLKK